MKIQAVLFDIDGTLVDSNDAHVSAWQEAIAGVGVSLDRETIHGQVGKGADNLLPALLPHADETVREQARKAHADIFKQRYMPRVEPFAHAHDLLARVKQSGRRVVLASSASQEELDHYLGLLDARALVSATTSADDVAHTKPAPDIFACALSKVPPVGADAAVVVGDSPYDMEGARKCRIAPVGLRSGKFGDGVLREAGASALYDDVAALLAQYDTSPLAQ